MQLDGFTLIAQIVNFLILVYLLKRFLYRPILDAMDKREAAIAARLQDATSREQKAAAAAANYQARLASLEAAREQKLAQARQEADAEYATQMERVRRDVEQTRQAWHKELTQEKAQYLHELRTRLGQSVCSLARRALEDLADAELEERLLTVLLKRLRDLTPEQHKLLAAGCAEEGASITVTSAFAMTPGQQNRIGAVLNAILDKEISIQFVQDGALHCGIVLTTPQQEIAWSLSDYFEQLNDELGTLVSNIDIDKANGLC